MAMTSSSDQAASRSSGPLSRIDAYEVGRLLGRGAMASVYEARDVTIGRFVAIKVLHPHLAYEDGAVARFLREGRALSRIHHPNVVRVLDMGRHDGAPYLVMSLVDGDDLGEHLARHAPLSVADTADRILPIISAIAAAHDAGIVHRDLKPNNIRLARIPHGALCPVVLDFGISKLPTEEESQDLTSTNATLGTASYMSPEQVHSPKQVDPRSDVYALGVILYECVTGKRPFRGDNSYELMHAIMTVSPIPPSVLRPEIPGTFDAIVLRAIRREAAERFASARDLGHALAAFAADSAAWRRAFASEPKALPSSNDRYMGLTSPSGSAAATEAARRARPRAQMDRGDARTAQQMGLELVRLDDLDIAIWLNAFNDPTQYEWNKGLRLLSDFIASRNGDISRFSQFVVTDGGSPNALQRRHLYAATFRGLPHKVAVITTVLRENPIKRGVATALQWLNPEFRVFEPSDVLCALAHTSIPSARFGRIWESLQSLQRSLPPNSALQEIGTVLSLR
jgi:serine/threonine protein kinase